MKTGGERLRKMLIEKSIPLRGGVFIDTYNQCVYN